jgi:hypothetical protein
LARPLLPLLFPSPFITSREPMRLRSEPPRVSTWKYKNMGGLQHKHVLLSTMPSLSNFFRHGLDNLCAQLYYTATAL